MMEGLKSHPWNEVLGVGCRANREPLQVVEQVRGETKVLPSNPVE